VSDLIALRAEIQLTCWRASIELEKRLHTPVAKPVTSNIVGKTAKNLQKVCHGHALLVAEISCQGMAGRKRVLRNARIVIAGPMGSDEKRAIGMRTDIKWSGVMMEKVFESIIR
jgi:hypothetical protein